ncbi:hypothetical protein [Synechococcus sp. PH41509]|nr:hypothetical protein [Synechococcus sp. PH41509]|tara:strand:- start:1993 stop:2133 length:141 start_codon:yes stop_codon:yes gene_type:complete
MADQIEEMLGSKSLNFLFFAEMASGFYKRARAFAQGETDLCLILIG